MITLNSMLESSPLTPAIQYLTLHADEPGQTAPSFQPGVNGANVVVQGSIHSLVENYTTGLGLTIPFVTPKNSIVTETSFSSDYGYIKSDLSNEIFKILKDKQLILGDGHVNSDTTKLSVDDLHKTIKVAKGVSIDMAWHVRETLLDAFFGTAVLLTNANASNTEIRPVNNQPGAFLLSTGAEAFLIESQPSQELDSQCSISRYR